jgi:hypothetical protein
VKKRLIAVIASLVLMLSFSVVPVSAAVINGSFSVGDAAAVTVTFGDASMTPQTTETVTVGVDAGTGRTLAELTEVKFKIWYDANAGATNVTEFDAVTEAAATAATITWNAGTTLFTLTQGGSTWVLGACAYPTLSNQTGDFSFVFQPGKVATETTGSDRWQLGATATITPDTGFGSDATPPDMDWFGELSIPATSLAWGSVPAGLDFGDSTQSQQALGQTITIISNGAYNLTALSDIAWTSAGADADLDSSGNTTTAQQFALKTDDGTAHASATLLASTATTIESGTITTEAGDTFTSINVWLKLASTFAVNTYSGTVSFLVANG